MAGPTQVAPDSADGLAEAADSLLDYLRSCKYSIGVDHYLRVQRLLASLTASGRAPELAEDLEPWVRALVCQSAKEQEGFARDFEDWLRIRGDRPAPPPEPVKQALEDIGRGWNRWLIAAGLAVLTLTAAISVWWSTKHGAKTPAPLGEGGISRTGSILGAMLDQGDLALILGATLVLAVLAFLLWRRSKLKAFLIQREAAGPSLTASLPIAGVTAPIYNSRLLRLAAQGFGVYRRVPSEDLNVPASVAATAREAGRFVPIHAERPAVPEYLVLIDRGSSADLFARFAAGITQALEDSNVATDPFYFDRTPQQCYSKRGERPVTIQRLSERFPDHRLLVFSDGAGFLLPASNQYAPWMEVFGNWETKTLLTPNPRAYWGWREKIIAAAGWTVISAQQDEMAALAQEAEPEKAKDGFVPGVLGSITANERRWLSRSAPPPEEIGELLTDLRISLGAAGFYWLCACAAYPAVDWTVTLCLGANLRAEDGRPLLRETAFLALSRLPWFRYGRLPEWLRLALLAKLSAEQQAEVRQVLQRLLVSGAAGLSNAYMIEFQRDQRRPLTWLARRFARRRVAKADEDDPLRDRVFLVFVSGGNPAALPLPERVANLFRRGAPGEWLGHSKEVWQWIGLSLLVQICRHSIRSPVHDTESATIGLAMLASGVFASYYYGARPFEPLNKSPSGILRLMLFSGAALAFIGSVINAFASDYFSAVLVNIGIAVMWPCAAVLIALANHGDAGRTLSALALWSATVYIPALLPDFPIWAKLTNSFLTAALTAPVLPQRPQGKARTILGATILVSVVAAVASKYVGTSWAAPLLLVGICGYAAFQLQRQAGALALYLMALLYETASVAGYQVAWKLPTFPAVRMSEVVAMVLLSMMWGRNIASGWNMRALAFPFGLLTLGSCLAYLAPKGAPAFFGELILMSGAPLANVMGTWLAIQTAPMFAPTAVALWWTLVFLIDALLFNQSIIRALPQQQLLLVSGALGTAGLVTVLLQGRNFRLSAASGGETGSRIIAASSYWLVGLVGLLIPSQRQNPFVRFHAVQAVLFFPAMAVCSGLSGLAVATLLGSPSNEYLVGSVAILLFTGLLVTMTIQAARGEIMRLPLIGYVAERAVEGFTPVPKFGSLWASDRTVFLASSFVGLEQERKAAAEALERIGVTVRGMEDFVVGEKIVDQFTDAIARSAIVVLIIDERAGYIDRLIGRSGIENEYEEAVRSRTPRLVFVKKSNEKALPDARTEAFRDRLRRENVVTFFETPEELARKVAAAVTGVLPSPQPRQPV